MPQIMDDNTVLLKFGVSLSDLIGMFTVSSGGQTVQAPKTSGVNAQFPVALRPGEVVVVSGLSRVVTADTQTRLSENAPMLAGGSNAVSLKREHFFIVIRPILL